MPAAFKRSGFPRFDLNRLRQKLLLAFGPKGYDALASIILDLQSYALDESKSIVDVVRRARFAAQKLELKEFEHWTVQEMDGYASIEDTPDYRVIRGVPRFYNPLHGRWLPVQVYDPNGILLKRKTPQSIVSVKEQSTGDGTLIFPYNYDLQRYLNQNANLGGLRFEIGMLVDRSSLFVLMSAVRDKVMDWSLKLERAGVLGEGMTFSERERKEARMVGDTHIYNNSNVGVAGNVSGGSAVHVQNTSIFTNSDLSSLANIADQIQGQTQALPPDIAHHIERQLAELKHELSSSKPKSQPIMACLRSIRTAAEGATGNLIAAGVAALLAKYGP